MSGVSILPSLWATVIALLSLLLVLRGYIFLNPIGERVHSYGVSPLLMWNSARLKSIIYPL